TTYIYTLSLHDALPISRVRRFHQAVRRHAQGSVLSAAGPSVDGRDEAGAQPALSHLSDVRRGRKADGARARPGDVRGAGVRDQRSEEHTSELQSLRHLV